MQLMLLYRTKCPEHYRQKHMVAMARVNMIKSAVSRRTSAHAPLDNVTTPYNPMRLLKGAPPGQVLPSLLKI